MVEAAVILLQCYATRTGSGCVPLSLHHSLAECQPIARDYQRFDRIALRRTGIPLIVSYRCMTAKGEGGR